MQKLLFTAAILVSSFLLFLVQPMFARMALPTLGGAPSVWNTALVFYQAVLLGGYTYAHWVGTTKNQRMAVRLHLALLMLPLIVLPIRLPDLGPAPVGSSPVPWLLALLFLGVGLPFFVVSSTSPLLQRWFGRSDHPMAENPYFLYAASNVGSLTALLAYPVFFERLMPLRLQSQVWSIGYCLLVLLLVWCGVGSLKAPVVEEAVEPEADAPTASQKLRWVALAFVPSCLLMGVTTYVSTEVAAVPLLWVVPLSIYLLTFTFAFAHKRWVPQKVWRFLLPLFLVLPLIVTIGGYRQERWLVLLAGFGGFFVATMFCHGELAELRPHKNRLTQFFLYVSLGGVLGGLFCGLLAPVVFTQVLEYPIAIVLCALLYRPTKPSARYLDVLVPAIACGVAFAGLWWIKDQSEWFETTLWKAMLAPAALALLAFGNSLRLALTVAIVAFVPIFFGPSPEARTYQSRSFFGTIIVRQNAYETTLGHGTTLHGEQFTDPLLHDEPVSYYHREGPVGDIMENRGLPKDAHVAVVGMGTGTMCAYAQQGQKFTFFEIDPGVLKVASDPKYFTYLSLHTGLWDVVLGDARLSLAASRDAYDLIVLDAYSSDAVPVHLLTQEAFALYVSKLNPGGAMAVHVSNRYMELWPVIASACEKLGLSVRERVDMGADYRKPEKSPSDWLLVARSEKDLGTLAGLTGWQKIKKPNGFVDWTDERSSLLDVLNDSPWSTGKRP